MNESNEERKHWRQEFTASASTIDHRAGLGEPVENMRRINRPPDSLVAMLDQPKPSATPSPWNEIWSDTESERPVCEKLPDAHTGRARVVSDCFPIPVAYRPRATFPVHGAVHSSCNQVESPRYNCTRWGWIALRSGHQLNFQWRPMLHSTERYLDPPLPGGT